MAKKETIQLGDKIDIFYDPKNNTHSLNIKSPLYQTNFLTEARQILSKGVYRAVKFIVKRVQEDRINLPSYINNTEVLHLKIPREDIIRWYPDEHAHRELKEAARWLNNTSINYETPTGWTFAKLIGEVSYDKDSGLDLYLTPGVLPLYQVVENNFTLLDFTATMAIKNKPATFFYDKCCKWRSKSFFTYTPEELNEALNTSSPVSKLKERYILPAEKELKDLYANSIVDIYFDCYEVRGGVGQGGTVQKWMFRIRRNIPGSPKDLLEQNAIKSKIIDIIKRSVPDLTSNDLFLQFNELSVDELSDLYRDMQRFEKDLKKGILRDARGILWFKLRNTYNININGKSRLTKNPKNDYPKYKKIGIDLNVEEVENQLIRFKQGTFHFQEETEERPSWWGMWEQAISWILENHTDNGNPMTDKQRDELRYMFSEQDKIRPELLNNSLKITFDRNIYINYIFKPFNPLYMNLYRDIISAVRTNFPENTDVYFSSGNYDGENKIFPVILSGEELLP